MPIAFDFQGKFIKKYSRKRKQKNCKLVFVDTLLEPPNLIPFLGGVPR